MLGFTVPGITEYTCRHCGANAGHDPEMCPRCGPICEACFVELRYPCDPPPTPQLLYFIRSAPTSGYRRAHIAMSNDEEEILLQGNYRTLCGIEVAPRLYRLDTDPRDVPICANCQREIDK